MRRNIDARAKTPRLSITLLATLKKPLVSIPSFATQVTEPSKKLTPAQRINAHKEVAIIGSGPAGLMAAFRLCQAGLQPIILERGPAFPKRHEAVGQLMDHGILDPEANFHFGLGGAGTYSDGKLYTRLKGAAIRFFLELLQRHGAGTIDEILIDAHPHVGTDRWPGVLENLCTTLTSMGCKLRFESKVVEFIQHRGHLRGVRTEKEDIDCEAVILSPGNSARDLFCTLAKRGISIQNKSIAVGVRMIHPQQLIDRIQFGSWAGHPALGKATYRLTCNIAGRGVYSFCMCPGGMVIPTATETGLLSINGMSNARRNTQWANAAIVVAVDQKDFPQTEPLAGVSFQQNLERAAYQAGTGQYLAPAQKLQDFLTDQKPKQDLDACGYRPGVTPYPLADLLPPPLAVCLQKGLAAFCRKMPGLDNQEALLLGLETRTSSPVRIERQPNGMSPSLQGLFPTGEGAGYAGGITSSAIDGLAQADRLIAWLNGS